MNKLAKRIVSLMVIGFILTGCFQQSVMDSLEERVNYVMKDNENESIEVIREEDSYVITITVLENSPNPIIELILEGDEPALRFFQGQIEEVLEVSIYLSDIYDENITLISRNLDEVYFIVKNGEIIYDIIEGNHE